MFPLISDTEFIQIQKLMYEYVGVKIGSGKKSMVAGRLGRRLRQLNIKSVSEYLAYISREENASEFQCMIDALTTHETYFFREPQHFEFLSTLACLAKESGREFHVWSAACSTGEEPYSIAMILSEILPQSQWSVVASDVSLSSVKEGQEGKFSEHKILKLPPPYLTRYFLKGVRSQQGTYLVDKKLRDRVEFTQVNLMNDLPGIGPFDVIFLRNVLIYFDNNTKSKIVSRLVDKLKPGGYLLVGHSETLTSITKDVDYIRPSVYRKLARMEYGT